MFCHQSAAATRFPSHGSGQPGLELRTATKLSSAGFEPTAILTFGLRVRRLNHLATRFDGCHHAMAHPNFLLDSAFQYGCHHAMAHPNFLLDSAFQ